ncbi:ABC transporter ATP-binding protein [Falseniella ignava]|uniref:ABC transporter domain-containing protein n=1 Tax=Falseniella ignava CCUG 37419 TaxID=883112 RepID=K1MDD7_9LACT|nr:ABC transporter ATP-binding protein [Falseniella ignava]EKB54094.1 hypothetical protein HMPREF9707_01271 [Falseniella ignava CCUG 37419]
MHIKFREVGYSVHNPILKDIDLAFQPGTIVALVAPNGMGKSTLFKGIMNSLVNVKGDICLQNHNYNYPLTEGNRVDIYQQISLMVDQKDLIGYKTGREHINFARQNWNSQILSDEVIDLLKMSDYVDKKVSQYSLGMKQRLCLAMQLATDTPIMLMDEVMNSLDIVNVDLISNILINLREQGKIIIIASHLLDNLSLYSDTVIFIKSKDEIIQIDTDKLEKILTLFMRKNHTLSKTFEKALFSEPFKNKFQINIDQITMDDIVEYMNHPMIRTVSVGDKSITDYYHEFYL